MMYADLEITQGGSVHIERPDQSKEKWLDT
jgi:hypothetical protein